MLNFQSALFMHRQRYTNITCYSSPINYQVAITESLSQRDREIKFIQTRFQSCISISSRTYKYCNKWALAQKTNELGRIIIHDMKSPKLLLPPIWDYLDFLQARIARRQPNFPWLTSCIPEHLAWRCIRTRLI